MSFLKQFHTITQDLNVKNISNRLLEEGKKDSLFIDYFGVNFNETNLVSVKLYFSFLSCFPSHELLEEFVQDDSMIKLIKEKWKTSKSFNFLHQGLTFGLKCYLKENRIEINKYVHFRTKEFPLGFPKEIILQKEELENYPGVCIEQHTSGPELKKYFYLTSLESRKKIFELFNLSQNKLAVEEIEMMEYTESDKENKVNLIIPKSEGVKKFLENENNISILKLSEYFYNKHQLYYYGPGLRFNSTTKAIYFLPKELYYSLHRVNTVKNILIHDEGK